MSVNKVVYGGNTLIDLSNDTVTAAKMLEGSKAHDKAGNSITGTIKDNGSISETMDGLNTKSVTVPSGYTAGGSVALDDTIDNLADEQSDILDQIATALAGKAAAAPIEPELQGKTVSPSTSQQIVTPDEGYDGLSKVTVNAMPTATQATPSITVSGGGKITASATQAAGYVASGTKSSAKQLTTQSAKTWIPTTSNQTISSGRYLTGMQTIKGDANLKAENIAEGVSIFGVTGTHKGGSSVETCTVMVVNNTSDDINEIWYTTYNDGTISTDASCIYAATAFYDDNSKTFTNVLKNSVFIIGCIAAGCSSYTVTPNVGITNADYNSQSLVVNLYNAADSITITIN